MRGMRRFSIYLIGYFSTQIVCAFIWGDVKSDLLPMVERWQHGPSMTAADLNAAVNKR